MPGKLESVVDHLLDGMHQISKIETVVGEPLQAGDAMLVPIHRLRVGFGVASVGAGGHGDSGEGNYGGRGVGGGVQVEPIAVVAIAKDGRPRLMAIDGEPEQMVGQLFEQIPDLLGRILNMVSRKRDDSSEVVRFEQEATKPELPKKEKRQAKSKEQTDDKE